MEKVLSPWISQVIFNFILAHMLMLYTFRSPLVPCLMDYWMVALAALIHSLGYFRDSLSFNGPFLRTYIAGEMFWCFIYLILLSLLDVTMDFWCSSEYANGNGQTPQWGFVKSLMDPKRGPTLQWGLVESLMGLNTGALSQRELCTTTRKTHNNL